VTRSDAVPARTGPALPALGTLESVLARTGPVVVAFSGGADSAFLAVAAQRALGAGRVLCVTAVSASLGAEETEHCAGVVREWGLRWRTVETAEMDDPVYVRNGPDRCARCKEALMDALAPIADEEGATVVLGVNRDDLGDHRPGQAAAAGRGARFPLVEAGFTKADVREWSRRIGLSTWDRPAAPCLSSRIPYGTPVTFQTLRSVDEAESGLRALGFREVRVRHHGSVARVEVGETDLDEALARRDEVVSVVRAAGYAFVALDLEGFRSGGLNRLVAPGARQLPAG